MRMHGEGILFPRVVIELTPDATISENGWWSNIEGKNIMNAPQKVKIFVPKIN